MARAIALIAILYLLVVVVSDLSQSLISVLDQFLVDDSGSSSFNISKSNTIVKQRCKDHLSCEFLTPAIEIYNSKIHKGIIYINQPSPQSIDTLASIKDQFYGSVAGRLPSCLVQRQGFHGDWLPGPEYQIETQNNSKSMNRQCTTKVESAIFLFPWERHNTFHAMNDNLLSVLASMSITYLTSQKLPDSLFLFKQHRSERQSLMFDLVHIIFDGRVFPASELFREGPHCVTHLVWGTSMKPFYRDSLVDLRRVIYLVLHDVLRSSLSSSSITQQNSDVNSMVRTTSVSGTSTKPRVIIVTRNTTKPLTDASRRLTTESEQQLAEAFRKVGAEVIICCDFRYVNTIPKLVSLFGQTDICIGIHGAGLSNCLLAPKKVVLLEMQVHHAFGFDSFMKVAHMARGYHIFHDIRSNSRNKSPHPDIGIILNDQSISEMVELCMSVYTATRSDDVIMDPSTRLLSGLKSLSTDNIFIYPSTWSSHIASNNQTTTNNSANTSTLRKDGVTEFKPAISSGEEVSPNIDGPQSHHKYWLFPPPDYSNITKASILGPFLSDNEQHCKLLPYYYFRIWTMPVKEHKYQCDRNKIYTKPSGQITNKLLTEFV